VDGSERPTGDAELRERLRAIEQRLAALESRLGTPAVQPVSPTAPPPPVVEPPPLPQTTPSPAGLPPKPPPWPRDLAPKVRAPEVQAVDYERFLGLAVLGRVGIAAVVLAAAYFGQMGWKHLGPLARVLLIEGAGLGLVGLGAWLAPRVRASYTALLWGGGVALTYLGGVLGKLRFDVLPTPVALAALLGSAALGQFLARRLGLQAMAVVALAGAYAAPVLVGKPSPTPTSFFILFLVLHGWAAWTERLWQWTAARALAVVATVVLAIAWWGDNGTVGAGSFVLHGLALWFGLVAPELVAAMRGEPERNVAGVLRGGASVLAGIGLGALLAAMVMVTAYHRSLEVVPMLLAFAALAGGPLLAPRAIVLGVAVARAGSLLLALAFVVWYAPMRHRDVADVELGVVLLGLAAIAALLLSTRRWTRVGDLGAAIAASLTWLALHQDGLGRAWAVVAVAPFLMLVFAGGWRAGRMFGVVFGAFAAHRWVADHGVSAAAATERGLAFAAAAAVATLGAIAAARVRDTLLAWTAAIVHAFLFVFWAMHSWTRGPGVITDVTSLWNVRTGAGAAMVALLFVARWRLPASEAPVRAVLAATAVAATWVLGLLELLDAVAPWGFGPRSLAVSLYSLAFAVVLLVVGFRRHLPALRWSALLAFGALVVKIGAHDLRELETPLRVLGSGVLGLVLLAAAWGYARASRPAA